MSDFEQNANLEGVAVVGLAGRFPGAKNTEQFWRNLRNGVESIRFFSDEELLEAGVNPAKLQDPKYVKAGAPLEEIESFDAGFFGFNPREAEIMDPQQRLFLETAWEAIE
ncbi:MAG: beta-ketoacyl synthase N-terminal-like domain-containing protein, partial [Tumebacillaceae bacterium]